MFNLWGVIKGLLVQDETDRTKELSISINPSATTGTRTTLQASQTANRTLTLPNSTSTLADINSAQTFDNKTINFSSGGTNTIVADSVNINYVNTGSGLTATNVQTAIDEVEGRVDTVQAGLTAHLVDAVDAHDASAISNVPAGNLVATDVQSALNELQGDIDSIGAAANTTLSNLVNTIAIPNGVHLLPANTLNVNLGSATKRFQNGYIDTLRDSSGIRSINSDTRFMIDAADATSLVWDLREMYDAAQISSIFWDARLLYDTTGTPSILFGNRELRDSANTTVFDYQNRQLKSGATVKLDYSGTDVSLNTRKLTNVSNGTAANDAVNKSQLDVKISDVVQDTTPQLGGDLDVNTFAIEGVSSPVLLAGQNTVRRAKQASKTSFIEEEYIHSISLLASQTNTVIADLTFAHATYEGIEITYKLRNAASAVKIGTIKVITNGTDISIVDTYTETADTGVSFSAVVNGANINIRYTSGASSATVRVDIKRFLT